MSAAEKERVPQRIPPLAMFEASPIRLQIQDRLASVPVGEFISYDEIDALVGFNVRSVSPHLLQYAKDRLVDEGIVFDVVTGEGLKRADDRMAVAVLEGSARRAIGAAQKARRIAGTIDYDALTPADRIRFGWEQIKIGAILQFGSRRMRDKFQKQLEAATDMRALVADSIKQFR